MEARGPSYNHRRGGGGQSDEDYSVSEHRRDNRDDSRSRRHDSSSSSSSRRNRCYRDYDRYDHHSRSYYNADRDGNRDDHHRRRHDHHSSSSRWHHRSRTPPSSSPSSSSARSEHRHRSSRNYDSSSRSSRIRRTGRDSSSRDRRRRSSSSPNNSTHHHHEDNMRLLQQQTNNETRQMPMSRPEENDNKYALSRGGEQKNTIESRRHFFDGDQKSDHFPIIPNVEDGDDFDKEQIHKEMQERLIQHLAKEGKVYPPPKPQASHPVFANDGSFMETFKRLQEQQQDLAADIIMSGAANNSRRPQPASSQSQPMLFGKRRGSKILKTGVVAKPKVIDEEEEQQATNTNDAWAMYLQEVKKYKSVSCDTDAKTRPLVNTMTAITEASLKTAPFDPRYPNTNQTRYCYQSYLDFHRCQKVRGDKYEPCQYFKKVFTSMCPNSWVEKWNEQIEAGTFAGRI